MTIVPVFAPVYRATHCPLNDMIDLTLLSERSGMRALQRRDRGLPYHNMYVRFRLQGNRLQASLGQPLPATLMFENPTVTALAESLLTEVLLPAAAAPPPASSPPAAPPPKEAELEGLAENEIALIEPDDRLLRAGAWHVPMYLRGRVEPVQLLLKVGAARLRVKENARLARFRLFRFAEEAETDRSSSKSKPRLRKIPKREKIARS